MGAPVKFATDRPARTDAAKARWHDELCRLFPDAERIVANDYGFTVYHPHPSPKISEFRVVWRYGAMPEAHEDRMAIAEWLCDSGEKLGSMSVIRYDEGSVSTLNR